MTRHLPSGTRSLMPLQVGGHVDRPLAVGDVAVAVLPHGEHLQPFLLGFGRELRPEHVLLDAAHVRAVLDQVRHLEHAEEVGFRRHDGRRQRHVDRAELQLLQQFLVAAELARAEHDDLGLVAELGVRAAARTRRRTLEQRTRLADVAELDLGLGRDGSGQQHKRRGYRSLEQMATRRCLSVRVSFDVSSCCYVES